MVVFAEHRQRQRLHGAGFPSGHVRLPSFPFRERKRAMRKTPPPVPSSVWGRGQLIEVDRAEKYVTTHSGHHRVVHGIATGADERRAGAALVGEPHAGERGVKPGGTRDYKNAGEGNGAWVRRVGNSRDCHTNVAKIFARRCLALALGWRRIDSDGQLALPLTLSISLTLLPATFLALFASAIALAGPRRGLA